MNLLRIHLLSDDEYMFCNNLQIAYQNLKNHQEVLNWY